MIKNHLGRKGFISAHSSSAHHGGQSGQGLKTGTWKQELEQWPSINTADQLAPPDLLCLLSHTPQNHLCPGAPPHWARSFHNSYPSRKCLPTCHAYRIISWFLNQGSFFPDDLSLCHIDKINKKLTNTVISPGRRDGALGTLMCVTVQATVIGYLVSGMSNNLQFQKH